MLASSKAANSCCSRMAVVMIPSSRRGYHWQRYAQRAKRCTDVICTSRLRRRWPLHTGQAQLATLGKRRPFARSRLRRRTVTKSPQADLLFQWSRAGTPPGPLLRECAAKVTDRIRSQEAACSTANAHRAQVAQWSLAASANVDGCDTRSKVRSSARQLVLLRTGLKLNPA